jgi:trehalose-6-phosphate synthase
MRITSGFCSLCFCLIAAPGAWAQIPERFSETYGNWQLRCEIRESAGASRQICEIVQSIQLAGQPQPLTQLAIGQSGADHDDLEAGIALQQHSELVDLRTQFAGRRVMLGVDRLDYTKGIRHRLQSIELLLERNPVLRREVAFVQVAVPSRDDVKEYRDLRTEVETEVGRINGRFTEPGHDVPVHYLYRGVSREKLAAYYRLADVMCVTPLKDGMNLVAKEFVTCQAAGDEAGTLLLSEFAGAILEFGEHAIRCNPFDVVGMSYLMEAALELDEAERRHRIHAMADAVRERDVYRWVHDELTEIERGHGRAAA